MQHHRHIARSAAALAAAYVAASFAFRDGQARDLRLGIVITRFGEHWSIAYYQASPAPD